MAGHSKWANIRHRKERMDAKRGKIFSRLIKEVAVAARVGGADSAANPRLRLALDKARAANVPNDNLERAIKRAAGRQEGEAYAEARYEGYGAGGAAILIDCLTDNKNRTYPEVRNVFTKHGGNLGGGGSVAYLFRRCGQLLFANAQDGDALMDIAIAHGAEDFFADDGGVEILAPPENLPALLDALKQAGREPDEADVIMRAEETVAIGGEAAHKLRRLLDALEDLEDAQAVYTNAQIEEETS